jgi:hypothetical protein
MDKKIDECSKIFVSWSWLVGIIFTIACGATGIAAFYFGEDGKQNDRIIKIETQIDKITTMAANIDSIKILLRRK